MNTAYLVIGIVVLFIIFVAIFVYGPSPINTSPTTVPVGPAKVAYTIVANYPGYPVTGVLTTDSLTLALSTTQYVSSYVTMIVENCDPGSSYTFNAQGSFFTAKTTVCQSTGQTPLVQAKFNSTYNYISTTLKIKGVSLTAKGPGLPSYGITVALEQRLT